MLDAGSGVILYDSPGIRNGKFGQLVFRLSLEPLLIGSPSSRSVSAWQMSNRQWLTPLFFTATASTWERNTYSRPWIYIFISKSLRQTSFGRWAKRLLMHKRLPSLVMKVRQARLTSIDPHNSLCSPQPAFVVTKESGPTSADRPVSGCDPCDEGAFTYL